VHEPGPGADVTFQDTCECRSEQDCTAKIQTGPCVTAACNACLCVAVKKPAGTACDDQNASTIEDKCDANGVCAGKPVTCGDGTCDQSVENCGNCIADCPCGEKQYCKNGQCVTAVCGNGQCEPPIEDCGSCVPDCGCKVTETCEKGACVSCSDFCKTKGYQCGKPTGTPCNCGDCPPGQACDGFYHCYGTAICGNHVCETGEDCSSCETDCGCPKGRKCVSGQCEDCGPICEKAGMECGFYEGCDCGSCSVCYKCNQGHCVPKCDCVCWQKECGEVDGCQCGNNQGGCPAGQECVGYKCLVGCDTLCNGVECGWQQDCICAFCSGCDACQGNQCGPGAGMDDYEVSPYNDTYETATDLGKTSDSDSESAREVKGTIDVDFDEDWYKIEVEDQFGFTLDPHFELLGLAEDKDLDLEVCYLCKSGETLGLAATPVDSVMETDSPIPGAKCFTAIRLWGQDETMDLSQVTCKGSVADGSATVYLHIFPVVGEDCGTSYTLKLHF